MTRDASFWRRFGILPPVLATLAAGPALAESFDCVMEPAVTVRLASAVPGLVDAMHVARGDTVSAGQVVAELNSVLETATVELLELRAANDAPVRSGEARLALIDARRERTEQLLARGVATRDAMEEIAADAISARSVLDQAEMEQALAAKDLERARAALSLRRIVSPVDGIVVERNLTAGEYAYQETHIVTIARLDPLHVETFLPVETFGRLKRGDVAIVRPDPPVEGEVEAVVSVIDPVFDSASGTYGVRLALPNPDNRLPGGHRCTVDVTLAPLNR